MERSDTSKIESEIVNSPEVEFGLQLSRKIYSAVKPVFGIRQQDFSVGRISHDFQYAVDDIAEGTVRKEFEAQWMLGRNWAYATEDQGLILPPGAQPEYFFLIDPVDGSRAAQIGTEQCCINIAGARNTNSEPTFEDLDFGIAHQIKDNLIYVAKKEKGVLVINPDGRIEQQQSRENSLKDLENAFLVYEQYGMREQYLGIVMDSLRSRVHCSNVYNSGAFSLLSVDIGQNNLYVDIRKKLIADFPSLNAGFKEVTKCMYPMDIAPEWLILQELGGTSTNADGVPFTSQRLWEFDPDGSWSANNQITLVAAGNPELHAKALTAIQEGFALLISK